MPARTLRRVIPALIIVAMAALGCDDGDDGDDPSPPEDPFADYSPDPDIYSAPVDEDAILEVDGKLAPADQLLLLMAEDADAAELQAALDDIGGVLVGQVPGVGLYQAQVPVGTVDDLRALIAQAETHPAVEGALLNYIVEYASAQPPSACTDEDDLHAAEGVDRCPLTDVHYFDLAPIMSKVNDSVTRHPVRIALIDSGIEKATGQFDGVHVKVIEAPSITPYDMMGHGTQVAGIIAADNRDGGVNGIASRVLGGKLEVMIGGSASYSTGTTIPARMWQTMHAFVAAIDQAAGPGKVRLINMSVGWHFPEPGEKADANKANEIFRKAFARWPDTLFVIAAGNENTSITLDNYAPAALDADNILTVGGTGACDPDHRWDWGGDNGSNYGPHVDIGAPGEKVPVMNFAPAPASSSPAGDPIYESGTSFSAPTVTALAAILLSLDPSLKPADLRWYILEYAYGTTPDLGGTRLNLIPPVLQLLVDKPVSGELKELIDSDDDPGFHDPQGIVYSRICDGAQIEVDGFGTYHFEPDPEQTNGMLTADAVNLMFTKQADEVSFMVGLVGELDLNVEYGMPEPVSVTYFDADTMGGATGGHLEFHECTITERDGIYDRPLEIQVIGELGGVLETVTAFENPVSRGFSGRFSCPLFFLQSEETGLSDWLESTCRNGNGP